MNQYLVNKGYGSVFRKKPRLKYGTKNYSNPFFQTKRTALRMPVLDYDFKFRLRFYAGTFLIGLLIAGGYLLYSSHFQIKNINVNGGGMIDPGKIREIAWEQANSSMLIFLPQKNLFVYDKSRLLQKLEEKYAFEEIVIDKKWPNTIDINYTEKSYAYVWQEDDKYYYASVNRDLISEANVLDITQKDYALINNLSVHKTSNSMITVEQKYIDYTIRLWDKFKEWPDYQIDRFLIDNDMNAIKIALRAGPSIYFNIEGDLDKQINKLNIIKNETLKNDFSKKQYIDLRVGDSVYYR